MPEEPDELRRVPVAPCPRALGSLRPPIPASLLVGAIRCERDTRRTTHETDRRDGHACVRHEFSRGLLGENERGRLPRAVIRDVKRKRAEVLRAISPERGLNRVQEPLDRRAFMRIVKCL